MEPAIIFGIAMGCLFFVALVVYVFMAFTKARVGVAF